MAKWRAFRWLPDTLAWWTFTVLGGVVVILSVMALAFLFYSRDDAALRAAAHQATDQLIVVMQMIEETPAEQRRSLIRRIDSPLIVIAPTHSPLVGRPDRPKRRGRSDNNFVTQAVREKLRAAQFPRGTEIRVDSLIQEIKAHPVPDSPRPNVDVPPLNVTQGLAAAQAFQSLTPEERDARIFQRMALGTPGPLDSRGMFRVSLKPAGVPWLEDTPWVNFLVPLMVGPAAKETLGPIAIVTLFALLVAVVALFAVNRAFQPLARFAGATERLGIDFNGPPLAESGPGEVRRAAHAFNTMQTRLKRFVEDRTQMLAAISHDLRTPITRLRLRAEFVDDADQRGKMLRDLEDMEEMISATLAFSRDDAAREPGVAVDIAAMLMAIAADARAVKQDVSYAGVRSCEVMGKPLSLKRALTNLIDNAVKYGARARIELLTNVDTVDIHIDDDGPGIPEQERERVFAPFVRLESSRSRETGGVGLGMTIARNMIRAMGGDVELQTPIGGGLRVKVTLPKVAVENTAAE